MIPSAPDRDRFPVTRRQFVRTAGLGLAGGSLATMLAARQAPAQIKGSNLRILTWSHFIPAYDTWFDKFAGEWGEKNGVKVRVDHIPHLEIPARMAAEFAAGAGHDILFNGSTILTRIYYKTLTDLTDIYDQIGKKYGGWIQAARSPVEVEGRIYGIPIYYILLPMEPSPAGTVWLMSLSRNTEASVKSLAMVPSVKMPAATSTGRLKGRMIRKKAVARLAPSIKAASSISRGRCWK